MISTQNDTWRTRPFALIVQFDVPHPVEYLPLCGRHARDEPIAERFVFDTEEGDKFGVGHVASRNNAALARNCPLPTYSMSPSLRSLPRGLLKDPAPKV